MFSFTAFEADNSFVSGLEAAVLPNGFPGTIRLITDISSLGSATDVVLTLSDSSGTEIESETLPVGSVSTLTGIGVTAFASLVDGSYSLSVQAIDGAGVAIGAPRLRRSRSATDLLRPCALRRKKRRLAPSWTRAPAQPSRLL